MHLASAAIITDGPIDPHIQQLRSTGGEIRWPSLLSHYLAGATGPKFAASLGLPLPLYFAYNGYG
jgi:hypothetical protein